MPDPIASARPGPGRAFGRFELRALLGNSARTLMWLAFDTRAAREALLALPAVAPASADERARWLADARHAARLDHPRLAPPLEVGLHDAWPYIACDRALGVTLGERLAAGPKPAHHEAAGWMCDALDGVAFAHEAGVAHGDLQRQHLLLDAHGRLRVMALGMVHAEGEAGASAVLGDRGSLYAALAAQRAAAERDLLAIGILLHELIGGAPAFGEIDVARVIERLSPHGREVLRLARSAPVPDALRAIVDRATGHPPRRRYHAARTFAAALQGWREADGSDGAGLVALLLDGLHRVGHLPALPGVGATVVRLSRTERESTGEMAEQVLLDFALSFELLRRVNSAQVQGMQAAGHAPVLTIRRAIAMLGLDGVRHAALALRAWPGPLSPDAASALQRLMKRVRFAGHVAQLVRPRGYDAEAVFLIALLQNLGRLVLHYHFPEDAAQIALLMQPVAEAAGASEQPGLSEERAAYAVLGSDLHALGLAVARHWGLGEEVLQMMRRFPADKPLRMSDGGADLLRAAASAGNDAVDIVSHLPAARQQLALEAVGKRYARVLGINTRDLTEAVQSARQMLADATPAAPAATDDHVRTARAERGV